MSDHPDAISVEQKRYHTFYNLAILLSFVTFVELVLIFLPFITGILFWTLVVLSVAKFFAVIFIFMHLIYDKTIYTLLFMSGLTLATGTVIALAVLFSPKTVDFEAMPDVVPPEELAETE